MRWAEQTPPGFRFAPKLAGNRPGLLADFGPRVGALGDRLGPIRVSLISARDEGMIELILGSLDPGLQVAFDLAHPSWDGIEPRLAAAGAVRVNDLEHDAPFRYVRFRDPPYDDEALREWAPRLRRSTCRSTRTSGTRTHRLRPPMRNDYWSCSISERGTSCRLRRWSPARRSALARTQRPSSCSGRSRAVPGS